MECTLAATHKRVKLTPTLNYISAAPPSLPRMNLSGQINIRLTSEVSSVI